MRRRPDGFYVSAHRLGFQEMLTNRLGYTHAVEKISTDNDINPSKSIDILCDPIKSQMLPIDKNYCRALN